MSCTYELNSRVFSKGVTWEMVEESPFDKGETLQFKENNKRLRFLSEDEIIRLLDECPKYLRPVVECAINTGMDKGELLKLKWGQIRNDFISLGKYKTRPNRQIPINDDLKALFKQIRRENHLRSEYVFTRNGKTPMNSIKRGFKAALIRAGIEDFRFKDLRHTFTSHFTMRGGSLKELQELMGHTTMTMTLRYAHLSQEHKKKAVNRLID